MKPRLAILALVVVGTMLMGAGTGLAVSGISSDSGDAGVAQYPTTTTTPTTTELPTRGTAGGVAGSVEESGGDPAAQEARQVTATGDSDGSLPFTGFAAIPLIGAGIALLTGGLVLRRRNDS